MKRVFALSLVGLLWVVPAGAQSNGNNNSNETENANQNGNANGQPSVGEIGAEGATGSEPFIVQNNSRWIGWNRPIINVEFLQNGNLDVAMQLNAGCGSSVGLCVSGEGFVDFAIWGNRRVALRVRPSNRQAINNRTLGVFTYETDPSARIPKIYYDIRMEVIPAYLGSEGFSQGNVLPPGIVSLWDYTQNRERWRVRTDLRTGAKLVRIYFQPLFESTETDIFAAPGTYSASIRLSILQR